MLKKNLFWIAIVFSTYTFIFLLFLMSPELSGKLAVLLGLGYLCLTLVPSNSIRWIPERFSLVKNIVRWVIMHRRDFGISAGLAFLAHADLSWFVLGKLQINFLFNPAIIFGSIGYLIFLSLLLTSNTIAIKKLRKNWKLVQSLVWAAIPFILIHSILATTIFEGELSKIGILGFGGLIAFVFLEATLIVINPDSRKTDQWKHIRLVIIGTIVALILFIIYPK